jgi:branched-chain amino acid transport system permease protein
MKNLKITSQMLLLILLFLVALAPGLIKNEYHVRILANLGIWILLATGLEIISGVCGQLSLGHAAFYGIGGYTAAVLSLKVGMPFWLALPCSALTTMLAGVLVGIPSLRFRGPYLVLVTIAFNYITHTVFLNWKSVTGGYEGMTQIPAPRVFGVTFDNPHKFVYIVFVLSIFLVWVYKRIYQSPLGRAWLSIRESESASEACGVPVGRFKLYAFAISTFYAGIAGCLFVHLNKFVSPEPFSFDASIHVLAMLIIGGMYSPFGGLVGAIILRIAHEFLSVFPQIENLLFGVMLVLILKFMPGGVGGLVRQLWVRWTQGSWAVKNG